MDDVSSESANLRDQLQKFLDYSWKEYRKCLFWSNIMVWCTAALGVFVVAAGVYDYAKLAAIIGAATSGLALLQKNYRYTESAYFWEQKHNEVKVLRDRIRYLAITGEEYRTVINEWIQYRKGFMDGKPMPDGLAGPKADAAGQVGGYNP